MPEPPAPARLHRRRRSHRRAHRHERAAVLAAVVVAVCLLALAVPRTLALVVVTPAENTLARMQRGIGVDREEIDLAIVSSLEAASWSEWGALWQGVAMAHLGRMQVLEDAPRSQLDALLQAEGALQRSLALRPANPFAWWQLATVTNALHRPDAQVTAALHLSVVTGNQVETLLFARLRLVLAKWPRLDDATRQAYTPQLAMAMRRKPREFITLVRRSLAEEHVRIAFRGERALLEAYERLIDRSLPLPHQS